jgi:hypothetical protein
MFELMYVLYIQSKDGSTECTFPAIKDPAQLMVSHAKSSKVFNFRHFSIGSLRHIILLKLADLFEGKKLCCIETVVWPSYYIQYSLSTLVYHC